MSGTKARSDRGMSNRLAVWLQPFGDCFTVPTWRHVLVLIAGAILSPGRRTVAAALRVVGLEQGGELHQLSSGAEPQQLVEPTDRRPFVATLGQHVCSRWPCHNRSR